MRCLVPIELLLLPREGIPCKQSRGVVHLQRCVLLLENQETIENTDLFP